MHSPFEWVDPERPAEECRAEVEFFGRRMIRARGLAREEEELVQQLWGKLSGLLAMPTELDVAGADQQPSAGKAVLRILRPGAEEAVALYWTQHPQTAPGGSAKLVETKTDDEVWRGAAAVHGQGDAARLVWHAMSKIFEHERSYRFEASQGCGPRWFRSVKYEQKDARLGFVNLTLQHLIFNTRKAEARASQELTADHPATRKIAAPEDLERQQERKQLAMKIRDWVGEDDYQLLHALFVDGLTYEEARKALMRPEKPGALRQQVVRLRQRVQQRMARAV